MKVNEINKLEDSRDSITKEVLERLIDENIESRRTKVQSDVEIIEEILEEYCHKVDKLKKLHTIPKMLDSIKDKEKELNKLLNDINNGASDKVDLFHRNIDETKKMLFKINKIVVSLTGDDCDSGSFNFYDGSTLNSLLIK